MTNVVRGMPPEQYHAVEALSAGGCWEMIEECPRQFWHASPWNPDRPAETSREFDVGTAAHLAILEPTRLAEAISLIDAPDYRTKAAQLARSAAYDAGLTPLLPHHLALVHRIADAVRTDPYAADLLDGAEIELSYFWRHDGVSCKARADLISRDGAVIGDVKTCESANPRAFQRAAFNLGYFLRPAWYCDGWRAATGAHVHDYWFVLVAKRPPHLVTVCRLDPRALEWGRMMCRHAVRTFRQCLQHRQWPGYCREPATLSLPAWAEYQLADREQAGDFSVDDLRRAAEFLQP